MYSGAEPVNVDSQIDHALRGGDAVDTVLDPELTHEILSAASRGPEALEGMLAALTPVERHAAFELLHKTVGNRVIDKALKRSSASDDVMARKDNLDRKWKGDALLERALARHDGAGGMAGPVSTAALGDPVAVVAAAETVTRKAVAEATVPAEAAAPAPTAAPASPTGLPVGDVTHSEARDEFLAREAYFAKKRGGDDLVARALARSRAAKASAST